jgi:hypothetical protein
LYVAKSLLRRLVKTVKKMSGQAPKELVRLAEDAQELLKKDANGARAGEGAKKRQHTGREHE